MKKRKTFKQWSDPLVTKAKARDVKLSNKNLDKLRDCWISWCLKTYGNDLNILFWCVYNDKVQDLIPDLESIFKTAIKDTDKGSMYNQPVVLGIEHGVTFK